MSGCQADKSANGQALFRSPPDGKVLAQDIKFSIAGKVVYIPLVAVTSSYKLPMSLAITCEARETFSTPNIPRICDDFPLDEVAKFSQLYSDPFPVVSLRIRLYGYGIMIDNHNFVGTSVCSHLTQEWARHICNEDYTDGPVKLLQAADSVGHFTLVHKNYLYTLGGNTIFNDLGADHISSYVHGPMAQISLNNPNPYALCTQEWCGVIMQLEGDLIAAWIIAINENQPDSLEKQARIIRAFVQFGMSKEEDFSALSNAVK